MENNQNSSEPPIGQVMLDVPKIIGLIPSYNSEKLCEMIVTTRYFGFNEEIIIACMEELGKRRIAGNTFIFEKYIEECTIQLPKLEVKMPDLRSTLQQAIKGFK